MTTQAVSKFKLPSYNSAVAVVLLLAALTRLGAIFVLRTDRSDPGAYEHTEIAREIVERQAFRFAFFGPRPQPTSHQAPALPLLLAAAFKISAADSQAFLLIEFFNVLLALATVAALIWLGAAMWSPAVGLAAGLTAALYPPLIYMATRVQVANWSVAFFLLIMVSAMALARRWTRSRGALLGAAGALGILGEPILAAPLAAAGLVLARAALRSPVPARRDGLTALAFALLSALLVLTPWTIRNYRIHGRILPVKSTFWYVFWQGNHLQATGTDKLALDPELAHKLAWRIGLSELESILETARRQAQSVDTHLTDGEMHELANLSDETARVDWFKSRIVAELLDHPAHYLRMCAVRVRQLLWFDSTNPRALALPYRASWLALLVTALMGCALARRYPPRHGILFLAMALALAAVHIAVIMSSRFRLPLEAALGLPAGLALAAAVRPVFSKLKI